MLRVNKLWILLPLLWTWGEGSAWAADAYRIQAEAVTQGTSRIKKIVAVAHYEQSPGEVWRVISTWKDFPAFLPRCEAVDVIESAPELDKVYLRMDLPPAVPDLWNILEIRKNSAEHRLDWQMLSGNMEKNTGTAEIQAEGKGSRLKMEVYADPGLFLPGWLITWGGKKFLPKILRAVGDRLQAKPIAVPTPK